MTTPNDVHEESRKNLDMFENESQDSKIKSENLSALIKAQEKLTLEQARNIVFQAIRVLEREDDVTLSAEDKKRAIALIKQSIERIRQNIEFFKQLKRNILNILHSLEELLALFTSDDHLFIEEQGFLWKSKRNKNNAYKLEDLHAVDIERLRHDIEQLNVAIKELQRHVPIDQDFMSMSQKVTAFEKLVIEYYSDIKELVEKRKKHKDYRKFLERTDLARILNLKLKRAAALLPEPATLLRNISNQLDTSIAQLEQSQTLIEQEISRVKNIKEIFKVDKSSKPRVLMLTHEFVKGGGVATVTYNLTKYLKKRFDVDVIERSIRGGEIGQFRYYLGSVHHHSAEFRDIGHIFNKYPNLKLSVIHTQSINFAYGLHHWENGGLDELKNIYSGIPVVCTCHSFVRYEKTLKNEPWMNYSISYQDQTISLSDEFIVLHSFGETLMRKYYPNVDPNKIHVIPNGIERHSGFLKALERVTKATRRRFLKDRLNILYAGRISQEKGLTELVKALPHIVNRFPHVKLIIAGDYKGASKYYTALAQELKDSKCSKNVEWLGFIKNEEMAEKIYNNSQYKPDMAILPSHHESFPMFALEAVSHGVPLLVTNCDGPREIYSPFKVDNPLDGVDSSFAVAVEPKNPRSIVDAVFWVVDHPKETHSILKNAMKEVDEKYTWDTVADQTGKLYKAAMKGDRFVSQYGVNQLQAKLIDLSQEELDFKRDNVSVGIIGHFKYRNDVYPDFIAEFCDELIKFLADKKVNAQGIALIGDDDNTSGVLVRQFYRPGLERVIMSGDMDVIVLFLDYSLSIEVMKIAKDKGSKIILVLPYWGIHEQLFDFIRLADFVFVFHREYATKLKAKTGKDVLSIPYVIGYDHEGKSLDKKKFKITYLGVINNAKKVHQCIPSFFRYFMDKASVLGKEIELWFYVDKNRGDKYAMEALRSFKSKYDKRNIIHIEYRDYPKGEEAKIIANSDVAILPSSFEEIGQLIVKSLYLKTPIVFPFDEHFYLNYPMAYYLRKYPFKCSYNIGHEDYSKDMKSIDGLGSPINWEDFWDKVLLVGMTKNVHHIMNVYHRFMRRYFTKRIFEKTFYPALEYVYTHVAAKKPSEIDITEKYTHPSSLLKAVGGKIEINNETELKFVRSKIKIASIYGLWSTFNMDHAESVNRLELARELANLGYHVDMIERKAFNISKYNPPRRLKCVGFNSADYYSYNVLMPTSLGGLATLKRLGLDSHPFIVGSMEKVVSDTSNTSGEESGESISHSVSEGQRFCHRIARIIHVWSEVPRDEWVRTYGSSEKDKIFISGIGAPTKIKQRNKNPFPPELKKKEILMFLGALPIGRHGMVNKLKRVAEELCDGKRTILCIISNDYKKLIENKVFQEEVNKGIIAVLPKVDATEQYTYYKYAALALNTGVGTHTDIISAKLIHYLRGGIPVVCENTYTNANLIRDDFNGYLVPYSDTDFKKYVAAVRKALEKSRKGKWNRKAIMEDIEKNHTWAARAKIYDRKILEALGFKLNYYSD